MARMLPARISPDVRSTAERRVFEWLQNDPGTDGWVALHSLGLARHQGLLFGEVDFVVLAPNLGVFCLEVKGGRVARKSGLWTFTDRFGQTNQKARGPFDQARESMFSLIRELSSRMPSESDVSRLLFGYGVIFPDIDFGVVGPDYDLVQVWDHSKIAQSGISAFIRRLSSYTQKNQIRIYGNSCERRLPTRQDIRQIADVLRGDFDRPMLLAAQLDEAERELNLLTHEQFRCLDMFEDNKRILIEGYAGTGKTLLAVEMARRALERGERVALLCFNKALGEWLSTRFRGLCNKGSYIGTFHAFMLSNVGECHATHDSTFYSNVLPNIFLENHRSAQFDRLIVDEAQDLVRKHYLTVFDSILRDGFDRGQWALFGDFSKQSIFQSGETAETLISMVEDCSTFARAKLTINCRNTKNIGIAVHLVCGTTCSYPPAAVAGPPVTYIKWTDEKEEQLQILEQLQRLETEGVSAGDIVILSPRSPRDSASSRVVSKLPTSSAFSGIKISSIAAFKGLESKVVFLVDCESLSSLSLYYVGMSRATTKLVVFENEHARKQRLSLMEEHFDV